jgi:hypothetical protein
MPQTEQRKLIQTIPNWVMAVTSFRQRDRKLNIVLDDNWFPSFDGMTNNGMNMLGYETRIERTR